MDDLPAVTLPKDVLETIARAVVDAEIHEGSEDTFMLGRVKMIIYALDHDAIYKAIDTERKARETGIK